MPHQSMSRYFHLLVLIVVLCGALSAPAQQWTQLPPTPDLPKPERSGMAAVNGIRLWYAVFGAGPPVILVHFQLLGAPDSGARPALPSHRAR